MGKSSDTVMGLLRSENSTSVEGENFVHGKPIPGDRFPP